MKNFYKRNTSFLLILTLMILPIFTNYITQYNLFNSKFYEDRNEEINFDLSENPLSSSEYDSVTGQIGEYHGKIFSTIMTTSPNCLINRDQSSLSIQPDIFIPDWRVTYANMNFENIQAINYTKDIETEANEFIFSSIHGPIYFFQKFSVELSQYVNNVSIFLQDIGNPTEFTDDNSWEIAIVNCTNDNLGTPNENETLGTLQKPHPLNYAAHWEIFDFKNSENGPIYLNASKLITNYTMDNGVEKFWFALRVKIPREDSDSGGGPKFLYINPDNGNENEIGEGETFSINPNFFTENYYKNHAVENITVRGNHTNYQGNLTSFSEFDEDRYYVDSNYTRFGGPTDYQHVADVYVKHNVDNLTAYGITFEDIIDGAKRAEINWWTEHYRYLYSINISVIANISSTEKITDAVLTVVDLTKMPPNNLLPLILLNQTEENRHEFVATDPWLKLEILRRFMNTTDNNSIKFRIIFAGDQAFNVTLNQLIVEIGELPILDAITSYDPMIQDLNYANAIILDNGTSSISEIEAVDKVNQLDEERYNAQAETDNMSIVFTFNVLEGIDESLFKVEDLHRWLFIQPNPIVPQIDIRITSNVSVDNRNSLNISTLEIFKGNKSLPIFDEEQNKSKWIAVSRLLSTNSYAFSEETTNLTIIDAVSTWTFMQLVNTSDNNSIIFRLRYVGNETLENFNVSINEFALIIYIQNAISSDLTSKISFGLNSATLLSSDIKMKNFGSDVSDNGYQRGVWSGYINNGIPSQGKFEFDVSSIWPEITFNVVGTYNIEKDNTFQWEYELGDNYERGLWYVGAECEYYDNNGQYTIYSTSRGLIVSVPSDWQPMSILNSTNPNQFVSEGGWTWTNATSGMFETVTVYNISDGYWKVKLNSSLTSMDISYNETADLKIDKKIKESVLIPDHYGGDVFFKVYDNSSNLIFEDVANLNDTHLENSTSFIWDIYKTTQEPGTYYMKTFWTVSNETHAFVALETRRMNISLYSVKLELLDIENYNNNSLYGDKILIVGRLTYENPGEPIEGETINIEIYDENNNLIEELSDITNEDGLIQTEYTLQEGSTSISIKLIYNTVGTLFAQTESKAQLSITLISHGQMYLNYFFMILPYMLGVMAGITVFVVLRHRHRKKLREMWSNDALVLDDLLKISHVMIIHKDVGVSIYNKEIAMAKIDPDLIGGFLHAISAFRTEIKKGEEAPKEGKGFEMDYGDFKIILTDGNFVRVALISDGIPSIKLKETQVAFTTEFENTYQSVLGKFDGDITHFRDADLMIEKFFNTTLMYPLQIGRHSGVIKLDQLEKALFEVAEEIQKEKKFFFVSSLLSFGLAGRKESRDQIISAILSLKQKGVLEPIKIE